MKKIAFFDIDGTLTSEIDGSIPQSAITAIRKARANGNLMFLNTGRCIQNVEPRFQEVGFDGFVCGCGTDIYCGGKNLLHVTQSHEITMELLKAARDTNVDIVFESSTAVAYDPVRPVIHPDAVAQYDAFVKRGYTMPTDLESPDFICDKFVIWFQDKEQLQAFRKISDVHFNCIDRGGTATAKQPESSLSLIITICQKRMPMHSETATMIFRCSPISRTVLRWEMHTRLLFLTGCPLSQKKRAKTVSPSLWNIFPFFRAASCSSFLINTFSDHLPLHASYLLPAVPALQTGDSVHSCHVPVLHLRSLPLLQQTTGIYFPRSYY